MQNGVAHFVNWEGLHLSEGSYLPLLNIRPERGLTLEAVDIVGFRIHFPVPDSGFADIGLVLKGPREATLVVVRDGQWDIHFLFMQCHHQLRVRHSAWNCDLSYFREKEEYFLRIGREEAHGGICRGWGQNDSQVELGVWLTPELLCALE